MTRQKENFAVFAVSLFAAITIVAIVGLYAVLDETERNQALIEIIKVLMQALMIGVLGVWIKHLFSEAAKIKERDRLQAEADAESKRKRRDAAEWAFRHLKKLCLQTARTAILPGRGSATGVFGAAEGHTYEDLVDYWFSIEPDGPANKAADAFRKLMEQLRAPEDKMTPEKSQLIKETCSSWAKYYESRYSYLIWERDPSDLNVPF